MPQRVHVYMGSCVYCVMHTILASSQENGSIHFLNLLTTGLRVWNMVFDSLLRLNEYHVSAK